MDLFQNIKQVMPAERKRQILLTVAIIILLLSICSIQVKGEHLLLQETKLSLSLKNSSIEQVLREIEKKTDYHFLYNNQLINVERKVNINIRDKSINDILKYLFSNNEVDYIVNGNRIILSPKGLNSPMTETVSQQQTKRIVGLVTDENEEPLPGATIIIKETNRGTIANAEGKFELILNQNENTLVFTFVGMEPQTVSVGNQRSLNVMLQAAYDLLDEVIVTGYQTISKERATGAYNIIKTEQLEKPATNIGQRIVGTSSGVQARTDANGNVSFEIRGQSSLLAAAQPLIVVDGFAIQGGLSSINPNDVKSITILKDAAAASIWGARSANGVIVITSKSGSEKGRGVRVDFNSFIKYSPKIDMYYLNPYASSPEIIDYEKKGFETNFFGGPWSPIPNSNSSLTGGYSAAVEAMNEHRLGFLSTEELNVILADLSTKDNREQIRKHLLQNPFSQQYNLSISSSNEKITNILALMYQHAKLNYLGNDNAKYHVNYRSQVNIFKWLDFSFLGTLVMDENNNNGLLYSGSPYHMLLNTDGSRAIVRNNFYWPNIERHVPYSLFPYPDWTYNPITEQESRSLKSKGLNSRIQVGLTFNILKGLSIDSKIQYEILNTENKSIYNEESFVVRNTINTTSTWDRATNKITQNLPNGGFLDQNRNYRNSYNWRNQLNFNRNILENNQVNFIIGSEMSSIVNQYFSNPRTYGYDDEKLTVGRFPNGVGGSGVYQLKNWLGQNQTFGYTNSFSYSTDRYFSLYANASYTYDNKYTLSASARTDASNLITDDPKYRYAPFWSVGASWTISKEEFMQHLSWINRLTIRSTYGFNGNVDKSTSFMPLISVPGTQNEYIQDYTASISSFGNPTLRWEKTGTIDLGLDFNLFNGKLFGKLDLYNKKGKDLIVSMSIPAVNGTSSQRLNMAEMINKGIEIELGSTSRLSGKDIVWAGNFNLSFNHNKITKLFKTTYSAYELYGGGTSAYVEGYDANTLWSFKYAGVVNQGTEDAPNWQPVVQGKDEELYDFTGWTPGDGRDYMLNMGTKVAPFTLGLVNTFKIYDFDLSFIITGKFGHKFNGLTFNYPSMSGGSAIPNKLYSEILNSDPSERVPIPFGKAEPRYYFWDRFYPYLDYRVQRADHVRLQEFNITYNMRNKILHMTGFKSAKLYFQANNLLTITNNKYGEDPEFPIGNLKPQPAYTFGINLSF